MSRRIGIIGFPMDLGGNRRGVDMGPSALRLTDMQERLAALGVEVVELGNVLVRTRGLVDRGTGDAHFLEEILRESYTYLAEHDGSMHRID